MNELTYSFTAYRGREIYTERDYPCLSKAIKDVEWYQREGWYIDYVDDSDGRVARVIDHDAIRKSNELIGGEYPCNR